MEDPDFVRFWDAYPRRVAKKEARKAWAQLKPDAELVERILDALEWQQFQPAWCDNGGKFVPHPATWLRGERWADEGAKLLHADPRGHFPPCRTHTECNRKLEQEIEARKAATT